MATRRGFSVVPIPFMRAPAGPGPAPLADPPRGAATYEYRRVFCGRSRERAAQAARCRACAARRLREPLPAGSGSSSAWSMTRSIGDNGLDRLDGDRLLRGGVRGRLLGVRGRLLLPLSLRRLRGGGRHVVGEFLRVRATTPRKRANRLSAGSISARAPARARRSARLRLLGLGPRQLELGLALRGRSSSLPRISTAGSSSSTGSGDTSSARGQLGSGGSGSGAGVLVALLDDLHARTLGLDRLGGHILLPIELEQLARELRAMGLRLGASDGT